MHLAFSIRQNDLASFIEHWSERYPDRTRDQRLYDPFIGSDLKCDWPALKSLFEWKNGGAIAGHKLESIRRNYFDPWTADDDLERRFLLPNTSGGAVWNIFYLHCRNHSKYPIYDQHTDRAMRYISTGEITPMFEPNENKRRVAYQSEYRPFIDRLLGHGFELRRVDQALFAFGKFLKLAKPFT